MAENRKRQQPSSPAARKAQRREIESIWAALHARHCVYCHEWVSDTLFARCAEAIKSRGDGGAIIETLPASMRDRVRAARWSARCRGPPHNAHWPERIDKFSFSHSRWKLECWRCDKRWIADSNVGDEKPSNWHTWEGHPRPKIAGDDGCAVPGHAFGVEGLRERYARFPGDLTTLWDEGQCTTVLSEKLTAAGRTANDVVSRTAEDICAKYFQPDDPYVECRECFALDWRHGVGAGLLATQNADWRHGARHCVKEPSTDNATLSATTIGVFRAVVDASVDDAIAAAAAEAPPRHRETVATLPYGARAVQPLGNGNVRYIF